MKRFVGLSTDVFLLILIVSLIGSCQQEQPGPSEKTWNRKYKVSELRAGFRDPPMFYAPHAFWFWNDSIDPDLCREMAAGMIEKGMNPGYIHPRHGGSGHGLPLSQWMSDEWFEAVDLALQEAEKAGMYLGFSDEYWWPSGRIGGRMLQEYPELQSLTLNYETWNKTGPWEVILPPNDFVVAARINARNLIMTESLQVISRGERKNWMVPTGDWRLYIYTRSPAQRYSRGGDFALPSYLNPELAGRTIEMALEPYADHFGERMGNNLGICLTDNEGNWGEGIGWSDYLPEHYRKMKGGDLIITLPLLWYRDDQGTWPTARCDFFDVVSDQYINKFWKPMNDWLAERGMLFISNFWEHSMLRQVEWVGDFFLAQRSFSLPGNDCLNLNAFQVMHFKETQSVCEFENRDFMSEIMGVRGWGQTPAEMKQVVNAITAWGVTHTVPHGINLNRDLEECIFPPDWYHDNPFWEHIDLWNDFTRRACFVNRQTW